MKKNEDRQEDHDILYCQLAAQLDSEGTCCVTPPFLIPRLIRQRHQLPKSLQISTIPRCTFVPSLKDTKIIQKPSKCPQQQSKPLSRQHTSSRPSSQQLNASRSLPFSTLGSESITSCTLHPLRESLSPRKRSYSSCEH